MANDLGGFAPDYIPPPGETILELLEKQEMTQTELARRLGSVTQAPPRSCEREGIDLS